MQKLASKHGGELTLNALRYLSIRVRAYPETQHLVTDLKKLREVLTEKQEALSEIREETMASTALVEYRDTLVDNKVTQLVRDVLSLVGGDRNSPVFTRLFPKAPSTLLRPVGGKEQALFVKTLVQTIHEVPEYEKFREFANELNALQTELSQEEGRREEYQQKEAVARGAYQNALTEAQRYYNRAYLHIQLLFDKDKAFVESFFRKLRRPSRENKDVALDGDQDDPSNLADDFGI